MGNGFSFVKDKGLCSLRSYLYASGSIQEGSSTAVGACKTICSMEIPAGQVTGFVHVVGQNYLAMMQAIQAAQGRLHAFTMAWCRRAQRPAWPQNEEDTSLLLDRSQKVST